MKERRADLHLHTCHSDGTWTPEELVRRAKEKELSAISITDHDSVDALEAAYHAAAAIGSGTTHPSRFAYGDLEILPGVEMTAAFQRRELHILGYGIHFKDAAWTDFLSQLQRRRQGRIQMMIEQLDRHGISVTLEEVQAAAGKQVPPVAGSRGPHEKIQWSGANSLGRPHLAEVLVRRGVVRSFDEAFQRYLGDNAPCFVKTAELTVEETVHRIQSAGGVAVLAHPYRIVEDAWIPQLVEAGLQGIEACHSEQTGAVAEKYRRLAKQHHLLVTGGSDCHGFRKSKGPLIGTVTIPYEWVERLKEAISSPSNKN